MMKIKITCLVIINYSYGNNNTFISIIYQIINIYIIMIKMDTRKIKKDKEEEEEVVVVVNSLIH